MLRVPRELLMPVILLFCVVGSFAINNTVFGVVLMLVFGVLAFLMEENGFPIAPAILGMVLGGDAGGELHHLDDQGRRQPRSPSSRARSPAASRSTAILVWCVPVLLYAWRSYRQAKA